MPLGSLNQAKVSLHTCTHTHTNTQTYTHLARHALPNSTLHETAEAGQYVDRRIHLTVVQLPVNVDLQQGGRNERKCQHKHTGLQCTRDQA